MEPTPVFLSGKFHGQTSLAGYSLQGHKELDTTEQVSPERVSPQTLSGQSSNDPLLGFNLLEQLTELRETFTHQIFSGEENCIFFHGDFFIRNLGQRLKFDDRQVAQWERISLPIQQTGVRSLGQKDPLEEEIATHSSILAWKIPGTEEPGGLQFMGSQSVRQN